MAEASQSPIYTPPPDLCTNLDRFRDFVNQRHSLKLKTYHDLHHFSVTRLNDFWLAVFSFCKIIASQPPTFAIDDNARIDKFPKFFPDTHINFAENLLCGGKDDAVAVIDANEVNLNSPRRYTWKQLKALVAQHAGLLRRSNVSKGDVVVLIGGNSARSLSFLLAAASIGAIFASFATDIGEKALADRVAQLKPRLMIVEARYRYNGKDNDISSKIKTAIAAIDGTKPSLIVAEGDHSKFDGAQKLTDVVGDEKAEDLKFERVPFNTPFIVMFSSGTTGTPKGIVHSQGGLLVNQYKEFQLHNNFGPDDIHFHYSGIGWTLWNISIGAMFAKTAMVLYDGSPFYPSPDEFLQGIFATGVTAYGGSPRFFSELQKLDIRPKKYAPKMHTLLSTGALLTPGTASWLAEAFGPVCQIGFSGGTELCGNFMTGTRSLPCYAGEIAVKELGMDIEAWGPDGKPVPDGEAGELVCKKPFPNMPAMFWNDPEYKRYHKSYFEGFKGKFPFLTANDGGHLTIKGVWTHGDLIRINPDTRGIYVLGRRQVIFSIFILTNLTSPSDGVLNPSGVRFGTSDLYNILSSPSMDGAVHDALAVGQQRQTSQHSDPAERVILFMKCAPEHSSGTRHPTPALQQHVRDAIIRDLSRRHVPHFMFEAGEIPHNANGKKMEIQVKQVCNGGRAALDKMTLTDAERGMLETFVRFYDVERVAENRGREAKL